MARLLHPALVATLTVFTASALAQSAIPPETWVDKDTGHRVHRFSAEPNSGGFYFNINAYTPDGKSMIYTAPDGIHVLDMDTKKTRLLIPNPPAAAPDAADPSAVRGAGAGRTPHALVAGSKTNSAFYTQSDPVTHVAAVYKADVYSGAIRKLIDLPRGLGVSSINADETLGVGTYNEADVSGGDPNATNAFVAPDPAAGRAARTSPAAQPPTGVQTVQTPTPTQP
jgi:oligogalacturonide lyase